MTERGFKTQYSNTLTLQHSAVEIFIWKDSLWHVSTELFPGMDTSI